ncbi:MAG: DUF4280 domain-containing protein [Burkholderiaceae bacterium]
MPQQTAMTATLMCTMGIGPSQLTVLPTNRVFALSQVAANIMDHVPLVNIMPFPMCNSIANPIVAAATAAKLGVFTPAACLPVTPAPWTPGAPTVYLGGMPALDSTSTCMCVYGGMISIVDPVALTVMQP